MIKLKKCPPIINEIDFPKHQRDPFIHNLLFSRWQVCAVIPLISSFIIGISPQSIAKRSSISSISACFIFLFLSLSLSSPQLNFATMMNWLGGNVPCLICSLYLGDNASCASLLVSSSSASSSVSSWRTAVLKLAHQHPLDPVMARGVVFGSEWCSQWLQLEIPWEFHWNSP